MSPLQAVTLWRAGMHEQPAEVDVGGGQQQQQPQHGAAAGVDSPEACQQYERSLKPLVFQVRRPVFVRHGDKVAGPPHRPTRNPSLLQTLPLLHDHYFRQQAQASPEGRNARLASCQLHHNAFPAGWPWRTHSFCCPAGSVSDRLRRITREVSSLAGQLPLSWESSVLVAMDEDRMDVLRVRARSINTCRPCRLRYCDSVAAGMQVPCSAPPV